MNENNNENDCNIILELFFCFILSIITSIIFGLPVIVIEMTKYQISGANLIFIWALWLLALLLFFIFHATKETPKKIPEFICHIMFK